MSYAAREVYVSSNGDRWFLVRGPERVFVRHAANAASGGRVTDIELGEFLSVDARGPEHQALRNLIGTLVAAPRGH
jgi:hypothetical protein